MTAQAFRNPAPTLRELCGKEPWHFLSTTSKGFGLIQRFSEDIDLSLAREDLGFGGGEDPAAKRSRKGQQKAVTALATAAKAHVQEVIVPKLRENFTRALVEPFDIELAESSSESKVLFYYPAAYDFAAYGGRYIKPVVLLELAARSDHYPTRDVNITSYAAVHFPNEFKEAPCAMLAQAPERTLLEKALFLHSAIHKKRIADRASACVRPGDALARRRDDEQGHPEVVRAGRSTQSSSLPTANTPAKRRLSGSTSCRATWVSGDVSVFSARWRAAPPQT